MGNGEIWKGRHWTGTSCWVAKEGSHGSESRGDIGSG